VSAVLALVSSVLWGTADFLGGTASRKMSALAVVGWSQAVGLLGVLVVVLAVGDLHLSSGPVGWGAAGGVVGMVALVSFYAALAGGTMGVVAPIAATGVVVPVAVGLAEGEHPGPVQVVGIVLAVVGVVLASGPEARGGAGGVRPLVLAVVAAGGFGLVLVCLAEGGRDSAGTTLLTMRCVSVSVLAVAALSARTTGGFRVADLGVLAAVGLGDAAANGTYAVATQTGLVSVTAVLASLYPAVTVLLARAVHAERMRRVQNLGVTATLAGVVLIAAGGG